jgi:hypothetical protein
MKCLYCQTDVSNESPVGVCKRCGVKVWGDKMFNAILDGMNKEKEKGNMELGRVGESPGSIQEMHKAIQDAKNSRK